MAFNQGSVSQGKSAVSLIDAFPSYLKKKSNYYWKPKHLCCHEEGFHEQRAPGHLSWFYFTRFTSKKITKINHKWLKYKPESSSLFSKWRWRCERVDRGDEKWWESRAEKAPVVFVVETLLSSFHTWAWERERWGGGGRGRDTGRPVWYQVLLGCFFLDGKQTGVMRFRQNAEPLDRREKRLLSELAKRLQTVIFSHFWFWRLGGEIVSERQCYFYYKRKILV